jgi:hypothetical protein
MTAIRVGLAPPAKQVPGFHVSTGLRAAAISSTRRTGAWVGACFSDAASFAPISAISSIASANASSVCLLSVSVGSMVRLSGTGQWTVGGW